MGTPIDRTAKTALDSNLVNGVTSDAPKVKANNDVLYNYSDTLNSALDTHAAATTLPHADSSVTGPKIRDAAVTTAKIADLAVTSAKIANGAVGVSQLATGLAVTADVNAQFAKRGIDVTSAPYNAVGDGVTNNSTAFQAANDALVAMGGGILYVPAGTFIANFIQDSNVYLVGSGVKTTTIKSASGSNKDVIQGRNFATLTGTTKQAPETRGVRYAGIRDVLIDGNKSNNTSGYGIRMWGCSWHFENVDVQNCVNDGIWTEFTTHDSPVGQADPSLQALESFYMNIKTMNNGGNGWNYRGPHDSSIINFVTFGNGGWGLYQNNGTLTGYLWNSWLNTLGSFYVGDALSVYKLQATGAYEGTGIEIAAPVGNCTFTDVYVAGHLNGIIVRGTNIRISGNVLDNRNATNTAGDAVTIDGAVNYSLSLNGTGNYNVFNPVSASGRNRIEGTFTMPSGKTLYTSDIKNVASYVNIVGQGDTAIEVFKFPTRTIDVAGWKPVMPQSNGTIITDTTAPTASLRGGVIKQAAIADLTGAPTMADFNNLLAKLRSSGLLT